MEYLEEQYENFEGEMRRLEGLISQLELWSDESTINHKREEIKLVQYVEMHHNLQEVYESLQAFIKEHRTCEERAEQIKACEERIEQQMSSYRETEEVIHDWIRAIKNRYVLVAKSPVLQANRSFIEEICQ